MLLRLSLRLRLFLLFAGLAAVVLAALVTGLVLGYQRLGDAAALDAFVQSGVVAAFASLGGLAWVWYLFDLNVAKPIDQLAGALRVRAHSDANGGIDANIAAYLGDLAPAAKAAAATLQETRTALAEAVARETTRLSGEKARLETLLSDVDAGVVLCSGDHALVFYNGQAVDLMGAGLATPGLDRRLFDYLREGPILLAHERLMATGDTDAASDILCATRAGNRVLSARMRLMAAEEGALPGYVLTLRDVTVEHAAHTRREALLTEVFDRVRRPAANLSTLLAAIPEGAAGPGRLDTALREEVATLTAAVTDLSRRHDEGRGEGWTLAMIRASDLLDSLRARMEGAGLGVETRADALLLRCNAFEVIALLSGLTDAIAQAGLARAFRLTVEEDGTGALIRLIWQGPALPMAELERWLDAPLEPGLTALPRRSVLEGHATEIWPEAVGAAENSLCMPIPQARRVVRRPEPIARPVVYDFDLLSKARSAKVQDTRLPDLTYVVFDTETTGLLPGQGDEIVQIAAVRVVNGRRVEGEVFNTLVNPRRPIPLSSTEVHGITDAMVQDAPLIEEVALRFHTFAKGAVLVAHNAPFDMAFLRRLEPGLGVRFDNPVLDTVLLSAVVFGQHAVHSLDALTHRLGLTIPEEARHTAIGDTIATADAFLKLMPMLQGMGFATFGAVLTEVRRHGRLLKDLN
ncbi:exonuclease domain-containing protein [Pseudorhodobacter sp. MZDSW-24AT]|uniref:exonuclease domain-containing protein n=1 Tax=Pseudorhodobacter sp. MZDSW-24AT TaxID=2052957 RepID=UPI000C1E2AE7|nr:exonuclease domain-containing protein [Pseudorhodobacter sp. MZDSW-24AT]PJF07894.1 DNA polymerase III subunit epsilon [Pseudorhodobacter sp. MZDSW-24AT]